MNWFKIGKEVHQGCNCHLYATAYLTYMQSTSCEMLGWMNHKLESRLQGGKKKIAGRNDHLRHADDTPLMVESEEELRNLLRSVKNLA